LSAGLTRRRFIRGSEAAEAAAVRPPWSLPEPRFRERCTQCGDCVTACDEKILCLDKTGLPEVNFRLGACTFCADCANACEPGALLPPVPEDGREPWSLEIRFEYACLEHQGITCRICGDGCQEEAISFRTNAATPRVPSLDEGRCNGCGYCRWVCPVDAVTIRSRQSASPGTKKMENEYS
jgi:ferredoxin-type protein NapF